MLWELLFWMSAVAVLYAYAGYPLLLVALRRMRSRPVLRRPVEPSVSLLVSAYNEAGVIEAKVRNSLALDYPASQLEIVVASDGSTDRTSEIARAVNGGSRARVIAYPTNRGKLAVLNETVPQLSGEIVALSDASSMLEPEALRRLVESFADPTVGAVSGVYRVIRQDAAAHGQQEDFYWRYETFLKIQEGELDSVLGAHGSLYAIRKALYPFPDPATINDDYVIPVRILQQGYRVAYEPRAVAVEEAQEMRGFSRRVRIMTGNFEQLREIAALLHPPRWMALFFFLSHKVARLLVPLAMALLIVANLLLLDRPLYRGMFGAQLVFYALVALGAAWQLRPKVLRLPYYFCMINAAAFVGAYHAVRGGRRVAWKHE
ncbi:MAG: glycosyltransferase family 2 protein [Gemmatimonadota bacterium]|nr:glycosyltransferase family 2 protein [Gemmatimonadota bacterium]